MPAFLPGLAVALSTLVATTTASVGGDLDDSSQPEIQMGIGYAVHDRQLAAVDGDNVFLEGETLVAWTRVSGVGTGAIQHVWYRNGVEVARVDLPVGMTRRWRSWSRHRVMPGTYEVSVLAPDGTELARERFDVYGFEDEPDC
jgi:hypothetical protein